MPSPSNNNYVMDAVLQMLEINQFYLGDNLIYLKQIDSGCVTLTYVDPPFSTGMTFYTDDGKKAYEDKFSVGELITFLRPRLIECHRILSKEGSLFLHGDIRFIYEAKSELDQIFGIDNFRNEIIWCYAGGGTYKDRFASKHDTILYYAKNAKNCKFHPQYVKYVQKNGTHSGGKEYRKDGKYLEDWWADIAPVRKPYYENVGYPTQKPKKLLERIMLSTTDQGDLIVDPFAGSGTSLVVAKEKNRRYIGIDNSGVAIVIAKKRLSNVKIYKQLF